MKLKISLMIGGLLTGLLAAGCTLSHGPSLGRPQRSTTVKVLQLNIWLEGTKVDNGFEKIVNVIIASGADVVAFSEVENYEGSWHERVLGRLREKGYPYYGRDAGGDVGLISRYPIVRTEVIYEGTGSIRGYYLQVPDHSVPLLVCSAHLDYKYYALYLPRGYNGGTPDFAMIDRNGDGDPDPETDVAAIQAYNEKSRKGEAIQAFIRYIGEKVPAGRPVILAGDFNDGSYLDWTPRAGDMFDHHHLVIPWLNSLRLQKAGFIDGYRKIYPDEVQYPGVTWPSAADGRETTSWTPKSDERDRIDYIYYRGEVLHPQKAYLVGPRQYWVKDHAVENEGRDPFICEDLPWPTDHKGVLIEFELKQ